MKKLLVCLCMLLSIASFAQEKQIVLKESNSIFFNDVVLDKTVARAIEKLQKLAFNEEPEIYIVLNTPGGSVFAGLNFIDFLKKYPKPIHTITLFSASMGFQIVNGNPGTRYVVDTGVLMSHPMSGGFYGEIGNDFNIENEMKALKEVAGTMDEKVVARSNGLQTLESYQKAYAKELWITGQSSVNSGYADEVVSISCDESLNKNYTESGKFLTEGFNIVKYQFEYSSCPLATFPVRYKISLIKFTMLGTEVEFNIISDGYNEENKTASGVFDSKFADKSLDISETTRKEINALVLRYAGSMKDKVKALQKGNL